MKKSGFKMKGYSYPGKSPLKQTKFPNSPHAIRRREKNKEEVDVNLNYQPVSGKVDADFDKGGNPAHEAKVSDFFKREMLPAKPVVLKGAKPLQVNPTKSSKTYDQIKTKPKTKPRPEPNIKKEVKLTEKNKSKKSMFNNDFLRDVAVGTAVGLLTKESDFEPVNIAGKQNKIM